MPPTRQDLRRIFWYDPVTGRLCWRYQAQGRAHGKLPGTIGRRGHWFVFVQGKLYSLSKLVWLWHRGKWPDRALWHLNGDVADTRIENLTERRPTP